MWDLIVSVPDHCLSFYFRAKSMNMRVRVVTERIGAEFYLNTSSEISPVLKNRFNNILNSGNFHPGMGPKYYLSYTQKWISVGS